MWCLGGPGHPYLHDGWRWNVTHRYIPEDLGAEARILIDLADNPKDVQTDSQGPRLGLVVPDELWERYQKYLGLQPEPKKGKGK